MGTSYSRLVFEEVRATLRACMAGLELPKQAHVEGVGAVDLDVPRWRVERLVTRVALIVLAYAQAQPGFEWDRGGHEVPRVRPPPGQTGGGDEDEDEELGEREDARGGEVHLPGGGLALRLRSLEWRVDARSNLFHSDGRDGVPPTLVLLRRGAGAKFNTLAGIAERVAGLHREHAGQLAAAEEAVAAAREAAAAARGAKAVEEAKGRLREADRAAAALQARGRALAARLPTAAQLAEELEAWRRRWAGGGDVDALLSEMVAGAATPRAERLFFRFNRGGREERADLPEDRREQDERAAQQAAAARQAAAAATKAIAAIEQKVDHLAKATAKVKGLFKPAPPGDADDAPRGDSLRALRAKLRERAAEAASAAKAVRKAWAEKERAVKAEIQEPGPDAHHAVERATTEANNAAKNAVTATKAEDEARAAVKRAEKALAGHRRELRDALDALALAKSRSGLARVLQARFALGESPALRPLLQNRAVWEVEPLWEARLLAGLRVDTDRFRATFEVAQPEQRLPEAALDMDGARILRLREPLVLYVDRLEPADDGGRGAKRAAKWRSWLACPGTAVRVREVHFWPRRSRGALDPVAAEVDMQDDARDLNMWDEFVSTMEVRLVCHDRELPPRGGGGGGGGPFSAVVEVPADQVARSPLFPAAAAGEGADLAARRAARRQAAREVAREAGEDPGYRGFTSPDQPVGVRTTGEDGATLRVLSLDPAAGGELRAVRYFDEHEAACPVSLVLLPADLDAFRELDAALRPHALRLGRRAAWPPGGVAAAFGEGGAVAPFLPGRRFAVERVAVAAGGKGIVPGQGLAPGQGLGEAESHAVVEALRAAAERALGARRSRWRNARLDGADAAAQAGGGGGASPRRSGSEDGGRTVSEDDIRLEVEEDGAEDGAAGDGAEDGAAGDGAEDGAAGDGAEDEAEDGAEDGAAGDGRGALTRWNDTRLEGRVPEGSPFQLTYVSNRVARVELRALGCMAPGAAPALPLPQPGELQLVSGFVTHGADGGACTWHLRLLRRVADADADGGARDEWGGWGVLQRAATLRARPVNLADDKGTGLLRVAAPDGGGGFALMLRAVDDQGAPDTTGTNNAVVELTDACEAARAARARADVEAGEGWRHPRDWRAFAGAVAVQRRVPQSAVWDAMLSLNPLVAACHGDMVAARRAARRPAASYPTLHELCAKLGRALCVACLGELEGELFGGGAAAAAAAAPPEQTRVLAVPARQAGRLPVLQRVELMRGLMRHLACELRRLTRERFVHAACDALRRSYGNDGAAAWVAEAVSRIDMQFRAELQGLGPPRHGWGDEAVGQVRRALMAGGAEWPAWLLEAYRAGELTDLAAERLGAAIAEAGRALPAVQGMLPLEPYAPPPARRKSAPVSTLEKPGAAPSTAGAAAAASPSAGYS